jgi:hypothetical protein
MSTTAVTQQAFSRGRQKGTFMLSPTYGGGGMSHAAAFAWSRLISLDTSRGQSGKLVPARD